MKITTIEELYLAASMYNEYKFLEETFLNKHWVLFGVKQELVDVVRADLEMYEAAYNMYMTAIKYKYGYARYGYAMKVPMHWQVLLYDGVYDCYAMYKDRELEMYPIQ